MLSLVILVSSKMNWRTFDFKYSFLHICLILRLFSFEFQSYAFDIFQLSPVTAAMRAACDFVCFSWKFKLV